MKSINGFRLFVQLTVDGVELRKEVISDVVDCSPLIHREIN